MKAVLVTGATTLVGARFVRSLLRDPSRPAVLAVGLEPEPRLLPLGHPRLHYRDLDLTRSRSLRRLLFGDARELGVEAVVHGATHRDVHDTGRRVHQINVEATRELLLLAERHPTIKRFVYLSYAEVYRIEHDQPGLIGEDHPLDFRPESPQRVRDRVEADLLVCSRAGMSPLRIAALRSAEVLAPDCGSQLWDYLQSRVCFRPLGFDPMINLLSCDDAVRAIHCALHSTADGAFNIPGRDTLPLSQVIAKYGRVTIGVPGPLMQPLYSWRHLTIGRQFRWDMNRRRFHFSGVLDGRRAAELLGYTPERPLSWPTQAAGFRPQASGPPSASAF